MSVRLCIVSDIRIHRDGLASALGATPGMDVAGAFGSGDDVAALPRPVDVVVFDIPVQDHVDFVAAVHRELPAAQLVALGVDEFEPEILVCAQAGMSGFLSRAASLGELAAMITSVVRNELVCSPAIAAQLFRRLAASPAEPLAGPPSALTTREREVLALIRDGLANKEIAGRLQIAEATVKNHVHHLLEKLQVKRRVQAARVSPATAFLRINKRLNQSA